MLNEQFKKQQYAAKHLNRTVIWWKEEDKIVVDLNSYVANAETIKMAPSWIQPRQAKWVPKGGIKGSITELSIWVADISDIVECGGGCA